ncbi:MAG: gliding motility-associated C-terminal domain-containing protein [Saprospiraceae bacterium]|nr:gliding motility-associated C-terminal domain-containing protein [Saprospiraceae bacterium]
MKNTGYHFFRVIIIMLLFLAGWSIPSFGTHIVGGQITYRHVGSNNKGQIFEISLTMRRDCYLGGDDAAFDPFARLSVFPIGTLNVQYIPDILNNPSLDKNVKFEKGIDRCFDEDENNDQIFFMNIAFNPDDTLNTYIYSDCGFEGEVVCVHETTYRGLVVLPTNTPTGFRFVYQRCCRNSSVENIIEPIESGATYFVDIPRDAIVSPQKNKAPKFRKWPDVYICNQKDLDFDHSAVDEDGDSLVYELYTPFMGGSLSDARPLNCYESDNFQTVFWRQPYSQNNMFGGTPLRIDPKTGHLTGRPALVGQFLIGILVKEYRKGKLLSTVYRDCQYNVRNCIEKPAPAFVVEGDGCNGLTIKLHNTTKDSFNSLSYTWYMNYPDTSNQRYTIHSDTSNASFNFTYDSIGRYNILLIAQRKRISSDSIVCAQQVSQTIEVFINTLRPDLRFFLNNCKLQEDSIEILMTDSSLIQTNVDSIITKNYRISQNGTILTSYPLGDNKGVTIGRNGIVRIEFSLQSSLGCDSTAVYEINPDDYFPKQKYKYTLSECPTDTVMKIKLENLSEEVNPNATLLTTKWIYNGDTISTLSPDILVSVGLGVTRISLISVFKEACVVEDSFSVDFDSLLPRANFQKDDIACATNDSVTFKLNYLSDMSKNISADSIHWMVFQPPSIYKLFGDTVTFLIPRDSNLVFNLAVKFANGCVDTLFVDQKTGPYASIQLSLDSFLLCPNDKKSILNNSNQNWTYSWSPLIGLDITDPNNPTVMSLDSNLTYFVTVTDGLCTDSASFDVISLNAGIRLEITADSTTCDGKVVLSVTGAIGEGQYVWSESTKFDPPLASGIDTLSTTFTGKSKTYYVKFSGVCDSPPDSINITSESIEINSLSPRNFCRQDTSRVFLLNTNLDHQLNIQWDTTNVHLISGDTTSSPLIGIGANENAPFWLSYVVENQFGCEKTDSVQINITNNASVDFSFNLKECGNTEICFELPASYGGTIKWDFGDVASTQDTSTVKNPCFSYDFIGTYIVQLTNQDSICPFITVSKEVIVNPQLALNQIADDSLCVGESLAFRAGANILSTEFTWCDEKGNTIGSGPTFETMFYKDTKIILKGKDNNGCTDMDTILVDVFNFQFSVEEFNDSLCIDSKKEIGLNVANPQDYSIQWGPAECIVSGADKVNPVINVMEGKTISLYLKHLPSGCEEDSLFKPFVTKRINLDLSAKNLCDGDSVQINLSIANPLKYTYIWGDSSKIVSNANIQNPWVKPSTSEVFKVLVTDILNGCFTSDSILVSVFQNPDVTVDADPEFTIYEGKELKLFVTDPIFNAIYRWNTNETTTSILVSPKVSSPYFVVVTDKNGCMDTAFVLVNVKQAKCDESDVFIPNAFSPNGDGVNDIFRVRSNFIEEMQLIIYNRWGQEVFNTTTLNDGWDGSFRGEELAPDAFAYYLKVLCVNGVEYSKIGNVTLVK